MAKKLVNPESGKYIDVHDFLKCSSAWRSAVQNAIVELDSSQETV